MKIIKNDINYSAILYLIYITNHKKIKYAILCLIYKVHKNKINSAVLYLEVNQNNYIKS